MKIVRKTRNIANSRTAIKVSSPQNKKLGYGKYRLPKADDIPADRYYSVIVRIENTVTSGSNKKAIAVYYDIAKFSDAYRKANKLFKEHEKLKVLYIKQIYPLDSEAYVRFLESMYDALNSDYEDDIDWNDCIGITEWISLGYGRYSEIGGIQKRGLWEE